MNHSDPTLRIAADVQLGSNVTLPGFCNLYGCTIGDGTIIREGATIHRGTKPGSATVIGERCFIMCGAHVAHNCHLGHEVKMTTGSMLGGYAHRAHGTHRNRSPAEPLAHPLDTAPPHRTHSLDTRAPCVAPPPYCRVAGLRGCIGWLCIDHSLTIP